MSALLIQELSALAFLLVLSVVSVTECIVLCGSHKDNWGLLLLVTVLVTKLFMYVNRAKVSFKESLKSWSCYQDQNLLKFSHSCYDGVRMSDLSEDRMFHCKECSDPQRNLQAFSTGMKNIFIVLAEMEWFNWGISQNWEGWKRPPQSPSSSLPAMCWDTSR